MRRAAEARNTLVAHPSGVYRLAMDPDAVVREIAVILSGTADRAAKASAAAEATRRAGGYRWVGIYDVADQLVVNLAWSGPGPPAYPVFAVTEGLTSTAIETRTTVVVGDVAADERYLEALGDTRSEIIVPVLDPGESRVIGTLDVERASRGVRAGRPAHAGARRRGPAPALDDLSTALPVLAPRLRGPRADSTDSRWRDPQDIAGRWIVHRRKLHPRPDVHLRKALE
jgi:L-methionine (R)-S-oxide reductase